MSLPNNSRPVSAGARRGVGRYPWPEPTVANWPDMGPDLVFAVEPACPGCAAPFEEDGDRYFMGGCLVCGWRRARRVVGVSA
jgi:hypothetical protein